MRGRSGRAPIGCPLDATHARRVRARRPGTSADGTAFVDPIRPGRSSCSRPSAGPCRDGAGPRVCRCATGHPPHQCEASRRHAPAGPSGLPAAGSTEIRKALAVLPMAHVPCSAYPTRSRGPWIRVAAAEQSRRASFRTGRHRQSRHMESPRIVWATAPTRQRSTPERRRRSLPSR
jgi:hypothetical protein